MALELEEELIQLGTFKNYKEDFNYLRRKMKNASLSKGETVFMQHPIESAVFRFIPKPDKVYCLIKFKGAPEYAIDDKTDIASIAFSEGKEITEQEYLKY